MKNVKMKIAGLVTVATGFVATSAHAALPDGAATAFTAVQTDGLALLDLAWPVAVAITGGFIILGLFKKAARRAAS